MDKKTILSGIQPTGHLCLGNYLGAINNWAKLQHEYNSIFLVVDMHAITVKQTPHELRNRCLSFAAQYIAAGIDPNVSTIVIQSHVPQHAELMWILNSITYLGELNRMTQFKDKSKNQKNINVGLFTYPVLMASDILLYNADLVPVGSDQKQHLELARDLAHRFNTKYSETFKIPEPYIGKRGSRIMSLQEPVNKMSKSDNNLNNIISLLDDEKTIKKKINSAVTDSGNDIKVAKNKPGMSNLINIYSLLTNEKVSHIEERFSGKLYSDFKHDLAEVIIESLKPIRKKYNSIINEKEYLYQVLNKGSEVSKNKAFKTISKVYRKVGFLKNNLK